MKFKKMDQENEKTKRCWKNWRK